MSGAPDKIMRFLKISYTYYGIQFRLIQQGVSHQAEYTLQHYAIRKMDNDREDFIAFFEVIEERLNLRMDKHIAEYEQKHPQESRESLL